MLIGIDIDDVLADLATALVRFHNDTYGTRLTKAHHCDYDLSKVWGCTQAESVARVMKFFESPLFDSITPVAGAVEGVSSLKGGGHRLVVITSRPGQIAAKTTGWVEKHFPGRFDDIYFASHAAGKDNVKKSGFCADLGVEIMLEDCLQIALECSGERVRVFLLDAPWNQSDGLPEGVTRVFSWDEMVRLIG